MDFKDLSKISLSATEERFEWQFIGPDLQSQAVFMRQASEGIVRTHSTFWLA